MENAIYHGIKARRGPGGIVIKAQVNGDVLLLSVQDNGAGMSSDRLEALRKQLADPVTAMEATPGEGLGGNRSYGMLNVQARIKLTFGDEYGITIDSTENEGTTVVITHPLVHAVPSSSDHDGRTGYEESVSSLDCRR